MFFQILSYSQPNINNIKKFSMEIFSIFTQKNIKKNIENNLSDFTKFI